MLLDLSLSNGGGVQVLSEGLDLVFELAVAVSDRALDSHSSCSQSKDDLLQFV